MGGVPAPATAVTAANETTTAAASSFIDGDLTMTRLLPCLVRERMTRSTDRLQRSWSGGRSDRTLHREERRATHGHTSSTPPRPQPRCPPMGSSHDAASLPRVRCILRPARARGSGRRPPRSDVEHATHALRVSQASAARWSRSFSPSASEQDGERPDRRPSRSHSEPRATTSRGGRRSARP